MPTNRVINRAGGGPCFEYNLIEWIADMGHGESLKKLTANETITDAQRRWYRGPCLHGLSDWNGDTVDEWDLRLKAECNGVELLKSETIFLGVGMTCTRLTIKNVGKRNMTQYMENVISKGIEKEWPITAPDPELRKSITSTEGYER